VLLVLLLLLLPAARANAAMFVCVQKHINMLVVDRPTFPVVAISGVSALARGAVSGIAGTPDIGEAC